MARGSHAKKIDTVHWTYGSFSALAVAAGASVAVNVLAAQHLPETLLRIRGEWIGSFDGAQAGGELSSVSAGLILVPEGTSTTVLWDPIGDGDAPWIWWDTFNLGYEEYVSNVVQADVISSARRVIDSKAMRKIRNTELQFVMTNAAIAGSAALNVAGAVRVLAGS